MFLWEPESKICLHIQLISQRSKEQKELTAPISHFFRDVWGGCYQNTRIISEPNLYTHYDKILNLTERVEQLRKDAYFVNLDKTNTIDPIDWLVANHTLSAPKMGSSKQLHMEIYTVIICLLILLATPGLLILSALGGDISLEISLNLRWISLRVLLLTQTYQLKNFTPLY